MRLSDLEAERERERLNGGSGSDGETARAPRGGGRLDVAGAVYFSQDCHLSPARFVAALTREVEKNGATDLEKAPWFGHGGGRSTNSGIVQREERKELRPYLYRNLHF